MSQLALYFGRCGSVHAEWMSHNFALHCDRIERSELTKASGQIWQFELTSLPNSAGVTSWRVSLSSRGNTRWRRAGQT